MQLGNLMSAQVHDEKALSFAQKTSVRIYEGCAWTILGRMLGKMEPPESSQRKESILKGIEPLKEFQAKPYVSRGHLFLGDLNDMDMK